VRFHAPACSDEILWDEHGDPTFPTIIGRIYDQDARHAIVYLLNERNAMPKQSRPKYSIHPVGELDGEPMLTLSAKHFDAAGAHTLAQVVADTFGKPVSLFVPGRRSPAGLYAPRVAAK
jgi:hypothetical protein